MVWELTLINDFRNLTLSVLILWPH